MMSRSSSGNGRTGDLGSAMRSTSGKPVVDWGDIMEKFVYLKDLGFVDRKRGVGEF